MKLSKLLRDTHKWVGVIGTVAFLNVAVTGFLLLQKKSQDWIQPPTRTGAEGGAEDLITLEELFRVVLAAGHEDFRTVEDIDRVDFRPGKRVHKVRSRHRYAEIQVDAVTGKILSTDWRPSDLLEDLHDGSFYGSWAHAWLLPVLSISLLFLLASGVWLWLDPILRRRRRRRARATPSPTGTE